MKTISTNKQAGAVSLFVVIFFMLLVTVVTVSFLRLMIHDQQQANNNDLSQSAYDSAQAGVEDAKRALLEYQKNCSNNPGNCAALATALNTSECNTALNGISGTGAPGPNGSTGEIKVQQSQNGSDAALDQAYTCVTINLQTQDYIGTLPANQSVLVPLSAASAFDRVQLQWFSNEDVSSSGSGSAVSLTGVAAGQPLITQGQWPVNRPSLMRAQLMQYANTFNLSSFDTVSGSQSNAATLFLYPTSQPGIGPRSFTAYDQRKPNPATDPTPKDSATTPLPISCVSSLSAGGYACTAELVLPQAIGGAANNSDRHAFLRLVSFYNASHFRATLWNGPVGAGNTPVSFDGVQPEIDSTGRANDVFRRVQSRVDLFDTTFPYPEATIDVTGNFCKDFAVTNTQYIAGATPCTP
jgi:Tfp pilus assembly protein PilX